MAFPSHQNPVARFTDFYIGHTAFSGISGIEHDPFRRKHFAYDRHQNDKANN